MFARPPACTASQCVRTAETLFRLEAGPNDPLHEDGRQPLHVRPPGMRHAEIGAAQIEALGPPARNSHTCLHAGCLRRLAS
jgi:hypothetical protein